MGGMWSITLQWAGLAAVITLASTGIFALPKLGPITRWKNAAGGSPYLLLVREWDPTVCIDEHCAREPLAKFTIHGLWPEYWNGTWPQYCSSAGFLLQNVTDLLPAMRTEWPSVFASDSRFWAHEWRRHGTCTGELFRDEHAFFAAVLKLHSNFNLNAVALESGVRAGGTYPQSWLEDVWTGAFGASCAVHCDRQSHVTEVWMCLDHSLQAFDCPQYIHRHCGNVSLPLPSGARDKADAQTQRGAAFKMERLSTGTA